jgi:glycosyltransferase involved in cell wall biosynthesis
MMQTIRPDVAGRTASDLPTGTAGKVVILAGTDRDSVAHCRALVDALQGLAREVVVVIDRADRDAGRDGLDATDVGSGVGLVDLDCASDWNGLLAKGADAWRLARVLEAEQPDVVHAIGLKPAALAALALHLTHARGVVAHLPDLGALQSDTGGLAWPYRQLAARLLASLLARPDSFLLVGREEDLADLRARGTDPGARFALLAGAGVDPDVYPVLPPSPSDMPVAAFVGSVDEASGVPELLQAFERLWARGLRLLLEVHGVRETEGAPGGLPEAVAAEWARLSLHPGVHCLAWPADTREIWRRAEICVWPASARQGLPHALLEAAACGRALIVSDGAGGSAFVRDNAEGLIVPAGDVAALGAALERLARDADLRQRMGAAARLRVLHGFTSAHIRAVLRGVYLSLAGAAAR